MWCDIPLVLLCCYCWVPSLLSLWCLGPHRCAPLFQNICNLANNSFSFPCDSEFATSHFPRTLSMICTELLCQYITGSLVQTGACLANLQRKFQHSCTVQYVAVAVAVAVAVGCIVVARAIQAIIFEAQAPTRRFILVIMLSC